jgi:hypothetical protein
MPSNTYNHESVSMGLSSAEIKTTLGPFEDQPSHNHMPKLGTHGRSPITICIRLCPMVILVFSSIPPPLSRLR